MAQQTPFAVLSREHVHQAPRRVQVVEWRSVALPAECWVEVPQDAGFAWTEAYHVCHPYGRRREESAGNQNYGRPEVLEQTFDPRADTVPALAMARRGHTPAPHEIQDVPWAPWTRAWHGVWAFNDTHHNYGARNDVRIFIRSAVEATLEYKHADEYYYEGDGPIDTTMLLPPFPADSSAAA